MFPNDEIQMIKLNNIILALKKIGRIMSISIENYYLVSIGTFIPP